MDAMPSECTSESSHFQALGECAFYSSVIEYSCMHGGVHVEMHRYTHIVRVRNGAYLLVHKYKDTACAHAPFSFTRVIRKVRMN